MTPYAETRIDREDLRLFKRIRCIVNIMPDLKLGTMPGGETVALSCHMLAIAVGKVWSLTVQHGSFLKGFDHSWIITSHRNVIDVYPIAMVGGPILIDGSAPTLVKQLYNPFSPADVVARYGKDFESLWFRTAVEQLVSVLTKSKNSF